jgi:hypothetical protein
MEFKDIAAVSGKSGLYQVLKPTRTGLILESLDGQGARFATGPHHRVSLLHEISIYTQEFEKTIPIHDILIKIRSEFGDDPGVDGKSEPDELTAFMEHIVPDYDRDKVYVSDMKKLINWYTILVKLAPELLDKKEDDKMEGDSETSEAPNESEAKPKAKEKAKKGE